MANYNNLKATINANIKANGNEEITGPILNTVLNQAVTTLGAGYQYMGVATPATSPGTPDANVFYIAATPGTYTNFGGKVVADGEVAILKYNGSWTKEVSGAATAAQVTQLGQDVGTNKTNITNLQQEIDEIQPIIIEGNVTNAPDEEDITTDENDLLKFADRPTAVNQMGYVILRKNKTFAEQVTKENTIYEIRYDFNLGGASVTVPTGSYLYFNGGKIANGFLSGDVINDTISPLWFLAFDDFIKSCNALSGYSKIDVPKGEYRASVGFVISHDVDIDFNGSKIVVDKSVRCFISLGDDSEPTTIAHLSAAADKGDYSISVDNGSLFQRGDILFLRDKTTSSYNDYRNYQEGEIIVVNNVSGNTIYLSNSLFGTYIAANLSNCIVYKPTMYRCNVRNLEVESDQTRENTELTMLFGMRLYESKIEAMRCNNFDIGISLSGCYNASVSHCDIYTPLAESYSGTLLNQYGVFIGNSQSIKVSYINGVCGNHICAIGGSYSDWFSIVSRLISFENCIGKSLHSNFPGMNIHGDGEYVNFMHCHTNGIDVGGNYITIKDCVLDADTQGRAIRLNEITGLAISIHNCVLNGNITSSNHIESTSINHFDEITEFIVKGCIIKATSILIVQGRNNFLHKTRVLFSENTIIGAATTFNYLLNQQPGLEIIFQQNVIYNFGINVTDSGEVTMVGNTIYNTNRSQEVMRYTNGAVPSIAFCRNFIRNRGTSTDFRFDSSSVRVPLLLFNDNYIESLENVNGLISSGKHADILLFRGNIINCNTSFSCGANTAYISTTPVLRGSMTVNATTLYDGTLANNPVGVNNELLAFGSGTQDDKVMVRGRQHGLTAARPANVGEGSPYYDISIHRALHYYSGWREYDDAVAGVTRAGLTDSRPNSSDIYVGFIYFDRSLGKSIVWNGTAWVNMDGTAL